MSLFSGGTEKESSEQQLSSEGGMLGGVGIGMAALAERAVTRESRAGSVGGEEMREQEGEKVLNLRHGRIFKTVEFRFQET